MKLKYRNGNVFLFFLCLLCFEARAQKNYESKPDIVVVVNSKTDVKSMSLEDIREIYLGNIRSFPSGASAVPTVNKGLSESFLMTVLEKNQEQFDAYWNVRQFTAKGISPREFSDDEGVMNWISANSEGIGFVEKKSITPEERRVKIIFRLHNQSS